MNKEFYFEVDDNGELNSISNIEGITEDECEVLINEWVKRDLIPIGEKTEGECEYDGKKWKVSGKVCVTLGEDESKDKWERFKFKD